MSQVVAVRSEGSAVNAVAAARPDRQQKDPRRFTRSSRSICRYFRERTTLGCIRRLRTETGSSIAEFGPALFILLIFALFPVLNLIFMGISYCSCQTLNDLQLREAAKVPKSLAENATGPVQKGIFEQWRASAMGGLAGVTDQPATDVSYSTGIGTVYVTVSTTVNIRPLLIIPFFPNVPGMGAPFICTISRSRMLENPKFVFQ